MSKEYISLLGLEALKASLLEATKMVCRNCGESLHLVNFKQRGFTEHGGAIAAGELSCPAGHWWKFWQIHSLFWVEVTINGYKIWERLGFRDSLIEKGKIDISWYTILVGEHH